MMTYRPRRSVLYMPGSNARALEKAKNLAADSLILDLEDAVAPDAKVSARNQIKAALEVGGYGQREVIVRVNGLDTAWGRDDLAMVAQSNANAVLVPKVSRTDDITQVLDLLNGAHASLELKLWVMMETPLAMLNAGQIAACAVSEGSRLAGFVMGTNDLVKETGVQMTPDRFALISWLSTCVAAARSYGLVIVDGVYNDLNNLDGFQQECEQGRQLGMDGKTLIHPKQLEICNKIFAPDAEEVAWSRKVLAAFELPEHKDKGAISLDGRMVERLHAEIAAKTVAIADAIEELTEK